MTRRRPTLRTRLLAALVLTAAGVLAFAGATTYLLVKATAEEAAIDDLEEKAAELQRQANAFGELLTVGGEREVGAARPRAQQEGADASTPARRLASYLSAVVRLLRLADARVVFLTSDGTVLDAAATGRAALAESGRAEVFSLPPTVPAEAIDPERVLAGETVTGQSGSIVFLAEPISSRAISRASEQQAVIVLTQRVETNVVGRAGPSFLFAAAAALLVCVGVSFWLARRLTRHLQAVEETALRLAAGDLGARVPVRDRTEDELAALAATLNTMAAQLEQARGAERSFLLSVSHDLRTPLTSIRGYAEALGDGTLDAAGPEERARAAEIISGEARRLERLVRDLLDLARLDARQFSLHPRPCDASAVVRDAAAAFGPSAADLGLTLRTDHAPPSLAADIDADRLAQIVANLVENALKYATTSVAVSVAGDGDALTLAVEDDGPGIPADQVDRVFERLYTVRGVTGRSVGTGLGLAIVYELAGAMGGRARVEHSDAGGTRFVVRLPTGARRSQL